jgi:hypothetical protein
MSETPDAKKPGTNFITSAERVGEGNWEWMKAEGFRPHHTLSQEKLEYKEWRHYADEFGSDNVREGDAYDPDNDRPLRYMPGMTVYVREDPPANPPGQSGKAGS